MRVLFLAGSPAAVSRSTLLLNYARRWLGLAEDEAVVCKVGDFCPKALLGGDYNHPDIHRLAAQIAEADGIVVASPVYKAAYSGALKALLDLLPERALANKVVLPLMTAGSPAHQLALDYALKPVLSALKAEEIIGGVFATDRQVQYGDAGRAETIAPEILDRLEQQLEAFQSAIARRPVHQAIIAGADARS